MSRSSPFALARCSSTEYAAEAPAAPPPFPNRSCSMMNDPSSLPSSRTRPALLCHPLHPGRTVGPIDQAADLLKQVLNLVLDVVAAVVDDGVAREAVDLHHVAEKGVHRGRPGPGASAPIGSTNAWADGTNSVG